MDDFVFFAERYFLYSFPFLVTMEAGNISIQALDYVLGQDLDGLAQLREGLQSAQGAR